MRHAKGTDDEPIRDFFDCPITAILSREQLSALGMVAAEWGMLEMALESHGNLMLRLNGITLASLTGVAGGRRYAEILADAVPKYFPKEPKETAAAVKHLRSVAALAVERNDLLHGSWGNIFIAKGLHPAPSRVPNPNGADGFVRKKGKRMGRSFVYTTTQIEDVALRISRARMAINLAMYDLLPFY